MAHADPTPAASSMPTAPPRAAAPGPTPGAQPAAHAPAPEVQPAAHALVEALIEAGVDTFFGIPGGPVSPIFDAVLQVDGARLIESRHETSALFAAVDYHRASGRVPAVLVTAGPGITNAVTGVASAHLERVPLLLIAGDVAWQASGGKLLQDSGPAGIGVEQLLAPFVRAAIRASRPDTLVTQGLAALRAACQQQPPGPALLVAPIQLGRVPIAATPIASGIATTPPQPAAPPAWGGALETAARWLAEARRPLLVLGSGCRLHAAAMRRLVDTLHLPFVTTPQAKGVVDEAHPCALRHGGLAASRWARRYTAGGVDCALVLGTDLDDCSIGSTPYVASDGKLVHVDLDASVFGRNLPTALGIVGDVGEVASAMCQLWSSRGLRHEQVGTLLAEARTDSAFDRPAFASDSAARVAPHRALTDLQIAMPARTRFITDIGEHMLYALHYLTARDPLAFTIHLGLGSMGSGIAGAIGLALAEPDRPVACVCGDGGMQMTGMEALVALQHRLPIVFAVFNDARYNMVFHGYRQVFGREAKWETGFIDFVEWAHALGMPALRVERAGEITAERMAALMAVGGPVVLDIRIDRDQRFAGGGRNEALQHMSMPPPAGEPRAAATEPGAAR